MMIKNLMVRLNLRIRYHTINYLDDYLVKIEDDEE